VPDPADCPPVQQSIPGRWDGERPTAVSVEPITLNGEQMAPGRAEMTSSDEVGDRCTAIHQVLRSLAMNTVRSKTAL